MKVSKLYKLLETTTSPKTRVIKAQFATRPHFYDWERQVKVFSTFSNISEDELINMLGKPTYSKDETPVWDVVFQNNTVLSIRKSQNNDWVILGDERIGTSSDYAELLQSHINKEYINMKNKNRSLPTKFKPLNKRIDLD